MLSIEHYEIILPDSPRSPNVENKNFLFPLVLVVIPPIYLCMSERREHTLLFPERRHPSRAADGVRMHLHGHFEKPDEVIVSVDCVFRV